MASLNVVCVSCQSIRVGIMGHLNENDISRPAGGAYLMKMDALIMRLYVLLPGWAGPARAQSGCPNFFFPPLLPLFRVNYFFFDVIN